MIGIDSIQLIYIYIASVTIRIVSRCLMEIQVLALNKQQLQENSPL